jgi:hypothetical protein
MKYRDGEGPRVLGESGLLDLNQQDYPTQLNKALGLQVRPPGHIDTRVSVGIQLDDFTLPEFNYLRRLNLMSVFVGTAAVAAQFPVIQVIANVPSSLLVVERIIVTNANAAVQTISWGWGGFDGGVTVTPEARDSRNYQNPGAAYITKQNAAAPTAPNPNAGFVRLPVDATLDIPINHVVTNPTKGFATSACFKIVGNQVFTSLSVTILYRERVLLQQESSS